MATAANAVERLLDAVKQLSPEELAEFTARLAEWQEPVGDESLLIHQTKVQMSAADAKRLRRRAEKSERRSLGPAELEEYRRLAATAERINAMRVRALAELARHRNEPISQIKKEIGWQEGRHGS
jgi:hypothetical protein